jgi:phosphatidylinositol glycan class B
VRPRAGWMERLRRGHVLQRLSPKALLTLALGLGLVARVVAAFDDGLFAPDEVSRSVEPAHALAFGYGLVPTDFVASASSWALPGLVAAVLKACASVGLEAPQVSLRVVKLALALLSVAAVLGVRRLAKAFGAPEEGAVAAAALWALAAPAVYFAPRALAESACAAPLAWGLALLFEDLRARPVFAASLLGLAALLHAPCAAAAVLVVIVLTTRRAWRALLLSLAGLAAAVIAVSALGAAVWRDVPEAPWVGWSLPLDVTRLATPAAWWTSLRAVATSMPTVALVLAVGLSVTLGRREWTLPALCGAVGLSSLVTSAGDVRALLPALPLAMACVGGALAAATELRAQLARLAVMFGLFSLLQAPFLTRARLGVSDEGSAASAWGTSANANRLLRLAGARDDLCGLRVDAVDLAWVGGAALVHRRVPLYRPSEPADAHHFNYLLARDGMPTFEKVAADTGLALYRMPWACAVDEAFRWRLAPTP